MREVWRVRKNDCMCTPQAVSHPSQDDRDHECPYCICDDEGADITTVHEKCQNEAECAVCTMMNKLDQQTLTGLGMKRNKKLTTMLQLAPSVVQSLNSGQVPEERRQVLYRPFASYYAAKERSFDMWQMLAFSQCSIPIKLLHLQKGWGDVWCQLSKIASAVGYHDDHRSQIAAVKSASHGIITGSGSCNRKTPRRNRELTEKCSKLPGVVCGITPLARCIPVEERRFLDGECLSTFSLDSDKTQCVALNVCLGQVLSSKNCFY